MGITSIFPGGGGVQPDWNQNDSTQPDYIKNRPFYTGDPVETVLVEESTVSFAENHGLYMAQFPSTFEATVGETYKVSWDGTTYECACVNVNDVPTIGNLSIIGAGSDTGEPFFMDIINGDGIQIMTADTSASHTFSISATVVPVVKIDAKYLPNTVATKLLDLAARMFGHTSVVDNAFDNDKTLSITSLPACIESIGAYAFSGCINLDLTSLPSELTSIGVSAFSRCTNLALTSLPSGLTSIGVSAFSGCTKLALTSLPSGLTSIGSYAFTRCTNLALTSLPSGITSIGDKAFRGCTGLTSITFTGKPTTISSSAFEGCTNLTIINVPWAEGEVAGAPWGATNATINYNYTEA